MLNIGVIVGSTRQNRFAEKPARWILGELEKRKGVRAELLDLRDYPMPFFDQPMSPAWTPEPFKDEAVARWTRKIAAQDGFVVVAPEYNRSVSSVMKNAFDWVYKEWNQKAVGFVSYGVVGGARGVEHMRLIAVELQMAPVRSAVHLPLELFISLMKEDAPIAAERFAPAQQSADMMLDQLVWWTAALKNAREAGDEALAA